MAKTRETTFLYHQKRRDLLKTLKNMEFLGSATGFFSAFPFPPSIGFINFFKTLLKPAPQRPLPTSACEQRHLLTTLDSDRLRPNIACFNCASKESLSNWSSSVLCSSPNLLRPTDASSMLLFSFAKPIFINPSKKFRGNLKAFWL